MNEPVDLMTPEGVKAELAALTDRYRIRKRHLNALLKVLEDNAPTPMAQPAEAVTDGE